MTQPDLEGVVQELGKEMRVGRVAGGMSRLTDRSFDFSANSFASCVLPWFTGSQRLPESVNDRTAEKDPSHGGATEGLQSASRFVQCRGCTGNGVW